MTKADELKVDRGLRYYMHGKAIRQRVRARRRLAIRRTLRRRPPLSVLESLLSVPLTNAWSKDDDLTFIKEYIAWKKAEGWTSQKK